MGRKSSHNVGDFHGKLEVLEIISNNKPGQHVSLRCLCHYCNNETVMMNGNLIRKMNSCGCQQRKPETWKSSGPKTKPWQLASGKAARNNLEHTYKTSAKRRNLDYQLTTEEFTQLVTGNCQYCGDSLTQTKKGQGKTSGDFRYTGIDRVDSSKGYTRDNCVSCCWLCNNMKSSTEESVFIEHVKKIYNHNQ
jgi:hypothetical protein